MLSELPPRGIFDKKMSSASPYVNYLFKIPFFYSRDFKYGNS